MKKIHLLLVTFYILNSAVNAQNRANYNSTIWWNELNFKAKLSSKFFYQVDVQIRTGSDASNKTDANTGNMFKNVSQLQFRPFFGYQIAENVQFMLAPGLAPTWTNPRSDHPTFTLEYRITPQFIVNQKIGRLALTHRYRFEARWFSKANESTNDFSQMFDGSNYSYNNTNHRFRFRYMFRIICPLNNTKIEQGTFYINFFEELHVNIGKNVPSTQQIDQNRLNLGLGYRMARDVRFEIGAFNQTAFVGNKGNTDVFSNTGVQFFIIFHDMKKLFKKAEVPVVPAEIGK